MPEDLAHLVFCLLAKEPADRPASAAEVGRLLRPYHLPLYPLLVHCAPAADNGCA
ncbi:hypothetical protein [Micromonospora haikouensis]|uniref:hypothetical protein n=1 Tax=Micromonospora haikouensis TaxID=686309 RepID=UPI003D717984